MPEEILEKTVYQVAADGTYIGVITLSSTTGDISPLDGEWLIPAGCVDVAPSISGENQVVKWQNGAWTLENILQTEPEQEDTTPQIITPEVDQEKADMWEAILALSAELETLKGGIL